MSEYPKTYRKMPSTSEYLVQDQPVVGLHDEVEMMISQLTKGRKKLDIFSVVGMPGIGKTTFAKKVYMDSSVIFHFDVRSWCCVSQVYNKRSLLLEILGEVVGHNFDKSEDDLALVLYQHLKGKRYLIILDDLWDISAWNSLKLSFPDNANGSRILLTSRHFDVALRIKPDGEPYSLRSLTNDESWELIQKNISHAKGCPPTLTSNGKEIVDICKGIPLMILIVAGILANMEQDAWKEVADGLRKGTLSIAEQCEETLELSYSHLPNHLKPCFLYFGAFQADQQIRVQELLWLWIAEGFVEKTGEKCLQHVAELYMMELIHRNLVMVSKKGSRGTVKYCVLHNLLHDFCMAKGNKEHFLHFRKSYELGTFIETNKLHRLRVHCRREDFDESRFLCPQLHCLIINADYEERRFAQHWYNIIYSFCQSRLLMVLDLRKINFGCFFPNVIELLVHLRYLALSIDISSIGPSIEVSTLIIPPSIQNLSNLETFIIERCQVDVLLPDSLWNMKQLRHLCITGALGCWKFSKENHGNDLENVDTLSTVFFSCGHTMKEVMSKFPNIRRLSCNLSTSGTPTEDCRNLKLDFMTQLESLTMNQIQHNFLYMHLELPRNLKKLVISNFLMPWSRISEIGELPNLEILKLHQSAFVGKIWNMEAGTFTKLRFLKLAGLHLARWNWSDPDENYMPRLETLVLEGCKLLEEIPSGLAYHCTLQMIEVFNCKSAAHSVEEIREKLEYFGHGDVKIFFHTTPRKRI